MASAVEIGLRSQLLERRGRLTALAGAGEATYVRDLLNEVDAALARMEGGTFGICEACDEAIETDRLLADPLCRLCLDHLSDRERHALEHDLELAGRIQSALLPDRELTFPGWQARTVYQPVGMVSGDYVDVIRSESNPDEAVFLFGDISGKGVAASLLMASLHAIFRSLAPLGLPLEDLLERANRVFCEHTLPNAYATLVCGRVGAGGTVRLANAGHLPPLVVRQGRVESLGATGLPLGLFCSGRYPTRTLELRPGDSLFLYTDGLTEAVDPSGEEYGVDRLTAALEALPTDDAIPGVLANLARFQRGTRRTDDLTLMSLHSR
jgi:sigma-B regulation protein RsbU (phosphoserine phosphatase)